MFVPAAQGGVSYEKPEQRWKIQFSELHCLKSTFAILNTYAMNHISQHVDIEIGSGIAVRGSTDTTSRPVTSLGHQRGGEEFSERDPNLLNYVQ